MENRSTPTGFFLFQDFIAKKQLLQLPYLVWAKYLEIIDNLQKMVILGTSSQLRMSLVMCLCWYLLLIGADGQRTNPDEVKALRAIKNSLGDPFNNLDRWRRGDPCRSNWTGIICYNRTLEDGYLHVSELTLLNRNLTGSLSPELGLLSYLKIMDFMWNNLTGTIPKEVGNIATLELLLLNGNQLSGSLPEELGNLSNLDRIQIDQNFISGPIPPSFANMRKAKHFHMNNNSLSGQIPPELSRLPILVHLLLDNNNLSGHLPPELSETPDLQILQLDNNNFGGTVIPSSYGNMTKLLKLSLRNCSLQGSIPDWSNSPNISYIDLSRNQLTGPIPTGALSQNITTIDLSNNNLTGPLPESFSRLPLLQKLSVANNSLNGSIPSIIWLNRTLNSTERMILDFGFNGFSSIDGDFIPRANVTIGLEGNPLCSKISLTDSCWPHDEDFSITFNTTTNYIGCPPQACAFPLEYAPPSPTIRCFCAAPIYVGYRLKSPGFSDFRPYIDIFKQYIGSGLEMNVSQLDIDSVAWQEGPRLGMYLKIFPAYNINNTTLRKFNQSEVLWIREMFGGWRIPDNPVFGPYEFLNFTLSEEYRDGQCENSWNEFLCRHGAGNQKLRKNLLIGGVSISAFLATFLVLFVLYRKKYELVPTWLGRNRAGGDEDIELFFKKNENLAIRRYKYSDLKKMTKSFSDKLGQGGYGTVYKGKLHDGRLAAVKVLDESKENGKEFLNELASISRTSHINIVSLLGFCFEGSKRALIYEFMPNGSLEKFTLNTASSSIVLGWDKLFEIAIGIARGLEYLHQGCNMRILHFDIKPHNILLDKDFNPKISDFGLAKLCPNRSSVVSMLVARGTIGYIAPELFSRNYEVSHKSDVYSYGMMVLEMAGETKDINRRDVDRTSEVYFPQHIYRQLEMEAEMEDSTDQGIVNATESQCMKRKLIIVGLWCIQPSPKDRPSMTKVVEMLEGKLESLQVPPKSYIFSPSRSASQYSTSETM